MFAANYVTDSLLTNAVLVRQFLLFETGRSYVTDGLFRELRMASELLRSVSVVLRLCANRKVFRVDAFRFVTGMKNAKTLWDWTFVYGKRKSVSAPNFPANSHHAISPFFLSESSLPEPAFIFRSLFKICLESVDVFRSKHTNSHKFRTTNYTGIHGNILNGDA